MRFVAVQVAIIRVRGGPVKADLNQNFLITTDADTMTNAKVAIALETHMVYKTVVVIKVY